jgi:DUF4097 and DUF4098 domain-containing protein YvlB
MIDVNCTIRNSILAVLALSLPAYAKCPISDGGTVIVRAAGGDLQVDTTGREQAVDVQVDNKAVQVQEICGKDVVQFTGMTLEENRGAVAWRIVTPRNVNLDLVTMTGNITVGDVNGNAELRTAGGSVTAGNISGRAVLVTQAGSVKSGNIGGNAEVRSQGGTLEVGDIAGNAEFHTTAGIIRAGNISGSVNAQSGQTISIRRAGEVRATSAGDISIDDARRINAKSGGGSITSRRVRGPVQAHTESGDIRLDSAASWVEASTGLGSIYVRLEPDNLDGDLHMNLQTGNGDVTVSLPPRLRASIDATVQRPAFRSQQIISEFPPVPARPPDTVFGANRFYSASRSQFSPNGGGNKIVLHTGLGKITIRKN